jgi:hypothetical protein
MPYEIAAKERKKLKNNPLTNIHLIGINKMIIIKNIDKKAMYRGYLAFLYSFLSIG